MTQFKDAVVFAVFDAAEKQSVALATQLMEHGIGCRADAQPYAMAWASDRFKAPLRKTQRSEQGFDRTTAAGNAAYMAVYRVLNFLYSVPKVGAKVEESKKPKFDAAKAAKQLKAKYTKAQLEKILAAW